MSELSKAEEIVGCFVKCWCKSPEDPMENRDNDPMITQNFNGNYA